MLQTFNKKWRGGDGAPDGFKRGRRRSSAFLGLQSTFEKTPPNHFSKTKNTTDPKLTPDEQEAFELLMNIASQFELKNDPNKKSIASFSPLAEAHSKILGGENGNIHAGHSTTTIQCDYKELRQYIAKRDDGRYLEKDPVVTINDHHTVNYFAKKFPSPVSVRDWFISVITKEDTVNETIHVFSVPCKVRERAIHPNRVRAEAWQMCVLKSIGPNKTRMDYFAKLNMKVSERRERERTARAIYYRHQLYSILLGAGLFAQICGQYGTPKALELSY